MSEPVYFQWQNEFLRKTIYPLREMKLRDFLIYYHEIDTWAKYKDKTEADIAPEVKLYQDGQQRLWEEAYEKFKSLWDYFITEDVTAEYSGRYPNRDQAFMDRLNNTHKLFAKYFPTYKNPRKERYFLASRVAEFEQLRKDLDRQLANKQRIVRNMGPNWAKTPLYNAEIEMLQNVTLKIADEELSRLYDFLAAFTRLEKRRSDLLAWKSKQEKLKSEREGRLNRLKGEFSKLEEQYKQGVARVDKLRNPPKYEDLKRYFLTPDVKEEYIRLFTNIDENFMNRIKLAHQQFEKFPDTKDRQKSFIDLLIKTYTPIWKTFKGIALQMAEVELEKLQDFYDAIDMESKTPEQRNSLISQAEVKRQELEAQLKSKSAEVKALEEEVKSIVQAVSKDEKEQLAVYTSTQSITVRDVVRGKVEEYQNTLSQLDQKQLLAEVLNRFQAGPPSRYPLWLQYMVIHFSGMRYQSAHGSWADPRDLVEALTEKSVEREIARADELAIETLYQEKLACYEQARTRPAGQPVKEGECEPPSLALTQKPKWVTKVKRHLETLKSLNLRVKVTPAEGKPSAILYKDQPGSAPAANPAISLRKDAEITVEPAPITRDREYYRILAYPFDLKVTGHLIPTEDVSIIPDNRKRKALLDLRVDEETYVIEEELTDDQALERLADMKDRLELPTWMWNEIVRMTELRNKEIESEDWEKPTAEELEKRMAYEWREYRQLMDEWKKANLTGWREAHDRSKRLIVTRAVCNEVAEHIQHLRGVTPPGGLTAKPEWYLRKERDPKLAGASDKPFFIKPKSAQDFKPGASIFWLRFVESEPNAWRIAHPLTLKDGSGLMTPGLNIVQGDNEQALRRISSNPKPNTTSEWVYHQDARSRYKRSRYVYDQNNARRPETQWLRWMHEATVVEVAETADGTVVLTFETALPYEDRRRSTIGVFKHTVNELLYNVSSGVFTGTFVGYAPQGDLPLVELQEMLDPDKTLQRKSVVLPATPPAQLALPGISVEVAPPISALDHKEWIVCYEIDPVRKTAAPYNPDGTSDLQVKLPRGVRLRILKSAPMAAGGNTYYQVALCEWDPRAQDLYVRADQVIDAPEDSSSAPYLAKNQVILKTIARVGAGGLPVMADAKPPETGQIIKLGVGTRLRVSTVHKLPGAGAGNGILKGDTGETYYLVVECPSRSSAVGTLIATNSVQKITEEEYASGAIMSLAQDAQKLRARVTPPAGRTSISLFRKIPGGERQISPGDTLVRDAELFLDSHLEFEPGKEYYRILEYPPNPKYTGLYVDAREVVAVLPSAEKAPV